MSPPGRPKGSWRCATHERAPGCEALADTDVAHMFRSMEARVLHTMLRVQNLESSLNFYVGLLGMRLLRRLDFVQDRFTLAFVGYGDERHTSVLELTHNWGQHCYDKGTGYGHLAIGVAHVSAAARLLVGAGVPLTRPPGPLRGDPGEFIAFVEDPDGYRIELIQRASPCWPGA